MSGIYHPNGCLCEGCDRARRQNWLDEPPLTRGVHRVRFYDCSCPVGAPCWNTACPRAPQPFIGPNTYT